MLKNLLNRITRHFLFRNEIPKKTFAEFEQEISQKNILGKTFSEIEKELHITKTEMDMIPPFASLRLKKDDVNFERTRKEFDKAARRLGLNLDRTARAESAIPSR